jgi:hypothetical protein
MAGRVNNKTPILVPMHISAYQINNDHFKTFIFHREEIAIHTPPYGRRRALKNQPQKPQKRKGMGFVKPKNAHVHGSS